MMSMLLLISLYILTADVSPIIPLGEAAEPKDPPSEVYKCSGKMTTKQEVRSKRSAQLTKGCELNGHDITFYLSSMYAASPDTDPVVIDILEANFIDSRIKLVNMNISDDTKKLMPLLFTIDKSTLSGTSQIGFGDNDEAVKGTFKLPPSSRLRIVNSKLTIDSKEGQPGIFTFYSLQLVTNSSIQIAYNVINMKYVTGHKAVFFLPRGSDMKISDGSKFTLLDNEINLNGHGKPKDEFKLHTRIWCQDMETHLTISDKSYYAWELNRITMVAYDFAGVTQYVWHHSGNSSLTISESSYKWMSNNISVVGYNIRIVLYQSIWRNHDDSHLTITQDSKYILTGNTMSITGHDVTAALFQFIWMAISEVNISNSVQFLIDSNKMLMTAYDYGTITSTVMMISAATGAISEGSSMVLRRNCVGMVQKKNDKRYVFTGKWTIEKGSELLLDVNSFATTSEYKLDVGTDVTVFMWGPKGATDVGIKAGKLTIRNIQVNANNPTSDATGSSVWRSSLTTYNANVQQPVIYWYMDPAKDGALPALDKSNVQEYMCAGLSNKDTSGSSAAIFPTIPAVVIILSLVFINFFI